MWNIYHTDPHNSSFLPNCINFCGINCWMDVHFFYQSQSTTHHLTNKAPVYFMTFWVPYYLYRSIALGDFPSRQLFRLCKSICSKKDIFFPVWTPYLWQHPPPYAFVHVAGSESILRLQFASSGPKEPEHMHPQLEHLGFAYTKGYVK